MTSFWLICAWFLPRTTLFLTWLFGNIPANDTPFGLDVLLTLICPRGLIAYWAYDLNLHVLWIILFIVGALLEIGVIGSRSSK